MRQLRKSKWEFVTSNGGNIAAGIVAAEGGSLTLADPSGTHVKFYYGGLGVGFAGGFKLPRIGRLTLPGAVVSSESMLSSGSIYMSPDFVGGELTTGSFTGGCLFCEAAAGAAWGHSGYAMTFGMNSAALASGLLDPLSRAYAHSSAKGYLFFHGYNFGLQASIGESSFVGFVRA